MDETLIRGLVMGAMLAALGITASLAWKLMRSTSEVARRTRQVLGAGIALLLILGFITGTSSDRTFMTVVAFILGAGIWITRGTKKP